MTYRGIVKGNVIELENNVALPEGMRVRVIPEEWVTTRGPEQPLSLREWLQEARQIQAQLPKTSDSVAILRQLRQERANR